MCVCACVFLLFGAPSLACLMGSQLQPLSGLCVFSLLLLACLWQAFPCMPAWRFTSFFELFREGSNEGKM